MESEIIGFSGLLSGFVGALFVQFDVLTYPSQIFLCLVLYHVYGVGCCLEKIISTREILDVEYTITTLNIPLNDIENKTHGELKQIGNTIAINIFAHIFCSTTCLIIGSL